MLTELPRAWARRMPDEPPDGVAALERRLDLVDLDRELLRSAGALPGAELHSLDAVHLASALRVRDSVDGFIACDERLLSAARRAGLAVARPA